MLKQIAITLTVLIIQLASFSFVSAQTKNINTNLTITEDTTWQGTVILDGITVTIESGATLTLKPGTVVAGKNGTSIFVSGKLVADGENDKKVRFTEEENRDKNFSLAYSIYTTNTSAIELKNFILEKGGGNKGNSATPTLTIKGKAKLTDGIIRRNRLTAVRIWNTDIKLEDCDIYENESIALENKTATELGVEKNWWGSKEKPKTASSPGGNWLSGSFDFDPWQSKGPIPIVILPGFGGSFSFRLLNDKAKDEWWLPPVGTAAYRHFAKALILSNYYHDKDFFWGFYDWREPIEESAEEYLEPVITKAKEESGHSQVHILAHSMGGLVARSYIQGDRFRDDVDRLVTAGTPHLGASVTYPIWEGGELTGGKRPLTLYLWYLQALDRNWNRIDYIRENFPTLGQMLPIYDYLINAVDGKVSPHENQNEQNEYLEDLAEGSEVLRRRVMLSLIAGSGEDTLDNIPVLTYSQNDGKWRDGIPEPLPPPEDTTRGDGTVTVKSATADGKLTEEVATIESKHGKLLESGEKTIIDQLKVKAKFPLIFKTLHYFLLSARGPVEAEIKDENGRIVSVEQREIADSRYYGFNAGKNNLIFSDFPVDPGEKKTFQVAFTGKEEGTFKASFWHLTENDDLSNSEVEYPIQAGVKVVFEVNLESLPDGEPKVSATNVSWSNLLDITFPKNNGTYLNWQYLIPQTNIREKEKILGNAQLCYEIDGNPVDSRVDLGTLKLGLHRLKAKGNWKIDGVGQNEEKEAAFIVSTSIKSLITLINRFNEEQKLANWEMRSTLMNLLAEAYQESSNGKTTSAKGRITEAKRVLEADDSLFADISTKDRLVENLEFLAIEQRF